VDIAHPKASIMLIDSETQRLDQSFRRIRAARWHQDLAIAAPWQGARAYQIAGITDRMDLDI
jgi:hypothetical protein